jgi:hypothetical protein
LCSWCRQRVLRGKELNCLLRLSVKDPNTSAGELQTGRHRHDRDASWSSSGVHEVRAES